MSRNSNQTKDAALGMSHGTAGGKLRKMIIFDLARRLGLTFCFKCGTEIETVDDLTIEHKEPWLGAKNSVEMFFDLENIAFSHAKCNRPHTHVKPKQVSEGMAWCSTCQSERLVESFYKNSNTYNGLSGECKLCRKTRGNR